MEKLRMIPLLACLGLAMAKIQVLHPNDLKYQIGNSGEIRSSMGNFGNVLYGTSTVSLN